MDRPGRVKAPVFPFLFGGAFIEGSAGNDARFRGYTFPFLFGGAFIEGHPKRLPGLAHRPHFPSFSEGLSLRAVFAETFTGTELYFPSFSEGLSLRDEHFAHRRISDHHFPSFSEGLSLRLQVGKHGTSALLGFLFLFWRGFH